MRINNPSEHHIIPSSRYNDNSLENIAIIDRDNHKKYHELFDNRTPVEIIERLVNEYWNCQWYHVEKACLKNIRN